MRAGYGKIEGIDHWRNRAEVARLLAEDMNCPESEAAMLRIAKDYDRLAERAQRRAKLTPTGIERSMSPEVITLCLRASNQIAGRVRSRF